MKNIFYIILLTLLTISQSGAQQKKHLYFDESYKKISFIDFNRKASSDFFNVATVIGDTVIYKKLRFREFFGNLDYKNKSQLNKLFHKRFKVDSTKVWFIHYIDSLPNINKMPSRSGIVFLDSLGNQKGEIISKKEFEKTIISRSSNSTKILFPTNHKHVISYKDYKKIVPKERKKYKRFKNIEFLHFYGFNKGYPSDDIHAEKWYKDYNLILKRTFTDGMKMYKTIIIHPNGDFCLDTHGKVKTMFNPKKISKAKKNWEKQFKKYR